MWQVWHKYWKKSFFNWPKIFSVLVQLWTLELGNNCRACGSITIGGLSLFFICRSSFWNELGYIGSSGQLLVCWMSIRRVILSEGDFVFLHLFASFASRRQWKILDEIKIKWIEKLEKLRKKERKRNSEKERERRSQNSEKIWRYQHFKHTKRERQS